MNYLLKLPKYKNVAISFEDGILSYINVFRRYVKKDIGKVMSLDNFVNLKYDHTKSMYIIKPYINHILEFRETKKVIDLSKPELIRIVKDTLENLEDDTSFEGFKEAVNRKVWLATRPDTKEYDEYSDLDVNEQNIVNNVNRLVTLIDKPSFEAYTDNNKTKTFDIIRVRVYLNTCISEESRKKAIHKNQEEIKQIVLKSIDSTSKFRKIGMSSNYLKISKLTYTKKPYSLVFVFELKDELKELENKI